MTLALAMAGCGDGGERGDRGGSGGAATASAPGPAAAASAGDSQGVASGHSLTIAMSPGEVGGSGEGIGTGAGAVDASDGEQAGPVLTPQSSYDAEEVAPRAVDTVGRELEPESMAGARLAIIIDDLGGGVAGTSELMQVRAPLTVAIMPGGRYAAQEARTAAEAGFAVILHQPMEPLDSSKNPGPGAITMGMTDAQIRATLDQNLKKVPGVIGVNNHMGSKVTEDSKAIETILRDVFSRGLFFIDSRTSSNSVVAKVASSMGARVLENSTFLDGVNTEDYVIEQIRSAAKKARSKGSAVAIGHVRPATVRAIQRMLPELAASGISLVTVDKLAPAIPLALRNPGGADREQDSAPAAQAVPVQAPVQVPVQAAGPAQGSIQGPSPAAAPAPVQAPAEAPVAGAETPALVPEAPAAPAVPSTPGVPAEPEAEPHSQATSEDAHLEPVEVSESAPQGVDEAIVAPSSDPDLSQS